MIIAFCHVSIFFYYDNQISPIYPKGCVENSKNAWRKLSEVQMIKRDNQAIRMSKWKWSMLHVYIWL